MEAEIKEQRKSWGTFQKLAHDRQGWRTLVTALYTKGVKGSHSKLRKYYKIKERLINYLRYVMHSYISGIMIRMLLLLVLIQGDRKEAVVALWANLVNGKLKGKDITRTKK